MKILAVIPARGGSKGLPGKNIRPLAGHPLIAYSIEAARQTPAVTRIICSTDSEEIAQVARQYGAEVPFLRPAHLAEDMSTDLDVFQHLLQELDRTEGYQPDLVLQLRPTSPIRRVSDIVYCIEQMLVHPEADSLRIVTESPNTPYKMWRLPDEGAAAPYLLPLLPAPAGEPEPYNAPRQRLPKTYWQIGTLDVIRPRAIRDMNSMSGRRILPHVIDASLAIDIDDISSFDKAERALEAMPGMVKV